MLTKKQKINKIKKKIELYFTGKPSSGVPVFIFGAQRSGTNMIMNVFKKSISIECYDENDEEAFDNYVLKSDSTIEQLIKKSRAEVIAFKPICNSQNAHSILNRFPQSKSIWIYRHYYDVVNSALRNWKNAAHQNLHCMLFDQHKAAWRLENVTQEELELVKKYYNSSSKNEATSRALFWYLRNNHFYKQHLENNKRVLLINYEELVKDSRYLFEIIYSYLNIQFCPKIVSKVVTSSIQKNSKPEINPDIALLCDELWAKLTNSYRIQKEITPFTAKTIAK